MYKNRNNHKKFLRLALPVLLCAVISSCSIFRHTEQAFKEQKEISRMAHMQAVQARIEKKEYHQRAVEERRIVNDLSPREVRAIMGKPDISRITGLNAGLHFMTFWIYREQNKIVFFTDNKVDKVEPFYPRKTKKR